MRAGARLVGGCLGTMMLVSCATGGGSTMPTVGGRLRVVATMSIIGDVVRNVGGDAIDLTVLVKPGQDPHSYEPVAEDIASIEHSQIVFANGLGLEASLMPVLDAQKSAIRIVNLSDDLPNLIMPEEGVSGSADPHVWQDPAYVKQWVATISRELGTLDPANADQYQQAGKRYVQQLDALDSAMVSQYEALTPGQRKLVTNHDALAYFGRRYGFRIVGTVYLGAGEVAEPSAGDMARLVSTIESEHVRAIFVETTVSDQLARVIAQEVGYDVKVLTLYTDSLGAPGSGADTYIGMMRSNMRAILDGLKS